jgi:hypothetical protein
MALLFVISRHCHFVPDPEANRSGSCRHRPLTGNNLNRARDFEIRNFSRVGFSLPSPDETVSLSEAG